MNEKPGPYIKYPMMWAAGSSFVPLKSSDIYQDQIKTDNLLNTGQKYIHPATKLLHIYLKLCPLISHLDLYLYFIFVFLIYDSGNQL